MGCFDFLCIRCPKCHGVIEFQSKAGACGQYRYPLSNAPSKILTDLNGKSKTCKDCGKLVTIRAKTIGYVE